MNKEDLATDWNDLRDPVHERWPNLTPEDLDAIKGRHDVLVEKIADAYDISQGEAAQEVANFMEARADAYSSDIPSAGVTPSP